MAAQIAVPIADLMALDASQLIEAYRGRLGCACGCRGKHRYWDAAEGTKNRGYEVTPGEVNRAWMAGVLQTIQEHAAEAEYIEPVPSPLGHGAIWSYEDETHLLIAYVR
jgi:hypothetical protein